MRPLFLLIACFALGTTSAADWPDRPVKIVAPFSPGGTADTLGRIVAQKLSDMFGQEFVPENKTGASGLIAAAEEAGIRFISDEIYHGLDYAFPAVTAAALSDRALVINSFSKYFCMTGWRVRRHDMIDPVLRRSATLSTTGRAPLPRIAPTSM